MAGKPKITQEEKDRVVELYNAGYTLRELEKMLHHDRKWMSKAIKQAGIEVRSTDHTSRRYHHNEDFFENIDTEEKAYWLGFIYADGYIQLRKDGADRLGITLSAEDITHLEKFKKDIKATNPIRTYHGSGYNSTGSYSKIELVSQKTVNDIKNKGVVESKTYILKFPDNNQVPEHLLRHFVRGYLDGDGCISKTTRKKYDYATFSIGFTGTADVLKGILSFLGKRDAKIFRSKNVYGVNIGGNKQLRGMLGCLYDNAKVYLPRKYKVYQSYLKYIER